MIIFEKMNGRKIEVKYETGAHYQITYLSESELKWEALSEVAEGEAEVGIDPYWTTNITDSIINVNWIEKDGLTVSQVLDFNTNTAVVFLTWEDDSEHGNRGSILQRGTFEIR